MIRNYFKIAWRNLIKNKTHSVINLAGLSVGIASSLLIMLWIQNELSVDAFHKNDARLFKVYEREYYADNTDGNYDTPGLLAAEVKKQLPEVEEAAMMQDDNHLATLEAGEKKIKVEGTGAGMGIFRMFSYPLLQGDPNTALAAPVNIAISKKTAEQFFGEPQYAIGKTIRFDNRKDFTVTAVFDDLPANVSRSFDYLISWDAWLQDNSWAKDWGNSGPLTYLLLKPGTDPAQVDKKLTHILDKNNPGRDAAYRVELGLQKFSEGYLHNHFKDGRVSGGRIEYIHLFTIVAIFILVIACINFMNLTTARSINRAKEVGVRKAVGAVRTVLIRQFIGESILLSALAVVIALVIAAALLPVFNTVTLKQLQLPLKDVSFWLVLILITLVTGVVSGSYPALFLSSFNPVKVLKSGVRLSAGAVWFRKGLVVFQFALSMVLIIGTIVVSRQVKFMQSKNLGYDRDNLVYIPVEGDLAGKYATFKQGALAMPGIQGVSRITGNPTYLDQQTNGVDWDGRDPGNMASFEHPSVGYDFVKTMKLQLAEGRDFSKDFPTDRDGFLVNETAAKKMGYAPAEGRRLVINGKKGTIIGVLKDFHFRSLHEQIQPMIIELDEQVGHGNILVRTQAGKTKEALAGMEALYKELNPRFSFSYSFSDTDFQRLYKSEQVVSSLSNAFAFLAIFISCLGLLGLVMFTAGQRTREIGIRKVLGASVLNILQLISADFFRLIAVAIVVASPIAWWAMSSWLDNYAYKITISWWIFVWAGLLAIGIAVFTISFQALKAAMANPVNSLRTE